MATTTTEKIFYIGKELFVKAWGPLDEPGSFDVDIVVKGKTLGGTVLFHYMQQDGKPETKQLGVLLSVKDTGEASMDIKTLHDLTGFILQNYKAVAATLGEAYDKGFFDIE